jgi:hypothetical protein
MKKFASVVVAVSILSVPAAAQVRPGDCRPVLPVVDQAAAVVPQDVVVPQAAPQVVAQRKFLGLPFLLPLIALGGGCAAFCGGGGNHNNGTPVSPA